MKKKLVDELGRPDREQYESMDKLPLIAVADNIRSLNNVGSLFRTADAFGPEALYLCGITATPPDREIHKTALGAEKSMAWAYFQQTTEALDRLKSEGFICLAIEQVTGAVSPQDFTIVPGKKYAVIFGNEVRGVAQEVIDRCDGAIEIPQIGTKHSLNVSVSAGIVLWEFFKRMR